MTGRLSTFAAAMVIARRDFGAILFSRAFFFFLLGPLFPVIVGAMAGGVGQRVQQSADRPELGLAMASADVDAVLAAGSAMPSLAAPAVGWPAFLALGVIYFAMAYLLLGSVFLAIGSLATTVREVQTLSMPVTMMQLMVFFLASFAMTQPGSLAEMFALAFPFSSPFAMMARAAQEPALWTHAAAIGWQLAWVVLLVRTGAKLFRKRVMKSGPARVKKARKPVWRVRQAAAAA